LPCYNTVVVDKKLSPRTKLYALLAMQNLNFDSYLQVLRTTFEAYEKGIVPYQILHLAIVNGFGWSSVLVNHRQDPRLQTVLSEIKTYPATPKKVIKSIDVRFK
ncbi:hypothetical protein, partial [Dyadobacter pollutisoli]|uniref:hypothetical protein n=1 Tax=Dyadobacter pollutisoli TaxID=2910158 RepID=UPI001FD2CBEA